MLHVSIAEPTSSGQQGLICVLSRLSYLFDTISTNWRYGRLNSAGPEVSSCSSRRSYLWTVLRLIFDEQMDRRPFP